jgi:hypothetical protein
MAENACDFQRSYMFWDVPYRTDPRPYARHDTPLGNRVRILLESLLDVADPSTGTSEQFVLIAPCRTEWVYAEDRLFQIPSREYRNIYSLTHGRGVGGGMTVTADELPGQPSRARPNTEDYRYLKIEVARYPGTKTLETVDELIAATEERLPINGRTELRDAATGRTYVLEYPIKTLNYEPEQRSFQVDTGPVIVPDLQATEGLMIDRLARAHVIYNHKHLDRAEFILYRPTPIVEGGREVARVMHYSEVQVHPATHTLLAGLPA